MSVINLHLRSVYSAIRAAVIDDAVKLVSPERTYSAAEVKALLFEVLMRDVPGRWAQIGARRVRAKP